MSCLLNLAKPHDIHRHENVRCRNSAYFCQQMSHPLLSEISTFPTPNIFEFMNHVGLGEAGKATGHLPPTVLEVC